MKNSESNALKMMLNPTVYTSRASLMGGASCGDRDAARLLDLIQRDEMFEERHSDRSDAAKENLYRFSKAYGMIVWTRNKISEKLFNSLKMTTFADLGCGLNPRGMAFSKRREIRYYGIDLPPVIEKMKRAMDPVIKAGELEKRIIYSAADITDLDTLRSLFIAREPLFIVTEGLMMYLTESEMQTAVGNIAALLSEHGGVWATFDSEEPAVCEYIMKNMFGGNEASVKQLIGSEISEQWRKLLYDNSFIKAKGKEQTALLNSFGLNVRKTHIGAHLDDMDIPGNIRKAFESAEFLLITSKKEDSKYLSPATKSEFSIESGNAGGTVTIRIHGRLDSMTAHTLPEEYEKYAPGETAVPVVIDMSDCPYISSAGIRAILMLFKRTKSITGGFMLRNIRPDVLEIMSTTGLTELIV